MLDSYRYRYYSAPLLKLKRKLLQHYRYRYSSTVLAGKGTNKNSTDRYWSTEN